MTASSNAFATRWGRKLFDNSSAEIALYTFAGLIILFTCRDYGYGWDEYSSSHYGELVLRYFRTGGKDKSCNQFFNLFLYGPTVDLLAAFIYEFIPALKLEIRHCIPAIFALLTVPALVRIGKTLGCRQIGLLAGLILLLHPRFYGHAFLNTKDIPFACGFAWSMCLLAESLTMSHASLTWKQAITLGTVIGVTTSIRPGGWMLFGLLVPLIIVVSQTARAQPSPIRSTSMLLGKVMTLLFVAWLTMVLPWPWAHESPVLHPILAIKMASQFHAEFPVLYEGVFHSSLHLPPMYLVKMIVITTPIPVLIFAGIGGVLCSMRFFDQKSPARTTAGTILLWLIVPVAVWTLMRPNIYDGIRHFLFVLPAISMLAAIGVRCLYGWIMKFIPKPLVQVLLTAMIISPAWSMFHLHPYQMTYYNALVGGLAGADEKFETDYWATSFREIAEWLNEQKDEKRERPLRILVKANQWNRMCIESFLDEGIEMTLLPETDADKKLPITDRYQNHSGEFPLQYDFFVASYRVNSAKYFRDSSIVHRVGRNGATFSVIKGHQTDQLER